MINDLDTPFTEEELAGLDNDPDFAAYMKPYNNYTGADYAAMSAMFTDRERSPEADQEAAYASMYSSGLAPSDLVPASRDAYQAYICKVETAKPT